MEDSRRHLFERWFRKFPGILRAETFAGLQKVLWKSNWRMVVRMIMNERLNGRLGSLEASDWKMVRGI
jgi:hypothetical protein